MIGFANVLITLLMIENIFVVFNNFLPVDNLKFYKPCALKVPGVSGHVCVTAWPQIMYSVGRTHIIYYEQVSDKTFKNRKSFNYSHPGCGVADAKYSMTPFTR